MHTLKIIGGGFLLLGICLIIRRWIGAELGAAVECFLGLWFIAVLVNMWFGVNKAGYSVADEIPIAVLNFVLPAVPAVLVWWGISRFYRG